MGETTKRKRRPKEQLPAPVHEVQGRVIAKVAIEDGALSLHGTEAAQARLLTALGTVSKDFADYALLQLINLLKGQSEGDLTQPVNAAVAMIEALAPKSEAEAMVAIQMVATHHMTMEVNRRFVSATDMRRCEAYANMAAKFARTYATQMEALGRHRRGGKQVVEHVHVNAGGQAVIAGTVHTGKGG